MLWDFAVCIGSHLLYFFVIYTLYIHALKLYCTQLHRLKYYAFLLAIMWKLRAYLITFWSALPLYIHICFSHHSSIFKALVSVRYPNNHTEKYLIFLHLEWPKLHWVLVILSAEGQNKIKIENSKDSALQTLHADTRNTLYLISVSVAVWTLLANC